jgi:isopentenyl phosphate kinase
VAAKKYRTRDGVRDAFDWLGYAEVAASAARLNQIVTDLFVAEGVPVISFPPSASARCEDGRLIHLDTDSIRHALSHRLVPLVQGDVALDTVRGGTIVSTEDVFVYLASEFRPARILLAGEVDGVYAKASLRGQVIDLITPANVDRYAAALGGSHGTDVTGGMIDKVDQMLKLVTQQPSIAVTIFSGAQPRNVERLLIEPARSIGTTIKHA